MRGHELVMVSEWMENGNIKQYLQKNPHADKLFLVSNYLACDLLWMPLTSLTADRRCARHHTFA